MTRKQPSPEVVDVDRVLCRLTEAVAAGDPDLLSSLFSEDATAVFTGSAGPVVGKKAILAIWTRHLGQWSDVRIVRRQTRVRIREDVAWAHFLWDGKGVRDGQVHRLEGERWTVVMQRSSEGWRFVQTHTSMPMLESPRQAEK